MAKLLRNLLQRLSVLSCWSTNDSSPYVSLQFVSRCSFLIFGKTPTIMYKLVFNKFLRDPFADLYWLTCSLSQSLSHCSCFFSSVSLCKLYLPWQTQTLKLVFSTQWCSALELDTLCRQKTGKIIKFTLLVFIQ